jgi:Fic-DOC domain mobile mystery protein B
MPSCDPIEGETPIADISELKIKGIAYRSQLNKAEAINNAKALSRYYVGILTEKEAPFDYAWLCALHREMFEEVWGWAGRLRTSVTNIGIEPQFIEQRLFELTQSLPYWKDQPMLMQATMLHHQAVQIHPFENGNGRWARAVANIWLYRNGHRPIDWSGTALSERSEIRDEYIEAVKAADLGDLGPLLSLHQRYTPEDKAAD